ncbi:hypothetical protein [Sphingopyxis sp. 2PD]|uniref:hypothetical protein n=1 Tax=Sphingopyxis sp. 2PD TaxID=2502196 RepID=UPI002015FA46|nr:hypothetical protein [Sphingopyxis sp. 2PD]
MFDIAEFEGERETVRPDAGDRRGRAGRKARRYRTQQRVADVVTEPVVDIVKPQDVELDQQHRGTCRDVDRGEPVEQAIAIEQAGQAINAGRVRHIADDPDKMCYRSAAIAKRHQAKCVSEHRPVAAIVAQRHRTFATFGQRGPHFGDLGLKPVVALQIAAILADRLGRRIAGDRLERRVHLDDRLSPLPHVGHQHPVADMVEREQGDERKFRRLARAPRQPGPPRRSECPGIADRATARLDFRRHGVATFCARAEQTHFSDFAPLDVRQDQVACHGLRI